MAAARHHILSVVVENRSGVLVRVANLFSRRGYNIFSLAVAPTGDERFSRITIVVDVESAPLEQITKQLHKLLNVTKITEIDPEEAVERELLLATVSVGPELRSRVIELVDVFGGSIVDVGSYQMTVALADDPSRLDDFEALLSEYSISDLQRSGRVALAKLERQPSRLRSVSGRPA